MNVVGSSSNQKGELTGLMRGRGHSILSCDMDPQCGNLSSGLNHFGSTSMEHRLILEGVHGQITRVSHSSLFRDEGLDNAIRNPCRRNLLSW